MAINALAVSVADCIPNTDELNLLSALLVQLGDTLATIAAQREFCSSLCSSKTEKSDQNSGNCR